MSDLLLGFGALLGLRYGRRSDLSNDTLERVFVAVCAVLFGSVNELLALATGVFLGLRLGHGGSSSAGRSLADLCQWREVRHGHRV